jgi:hypothetical protein
MYGIRRRVLAPVVEPPILTSWPSPCRNAFSRYFETATSFEVRGEAVSGQNAIEKDQNSILIWLFWTPAP